VERMATLLHWNLTGARGSEGRTRLGTLASVAYETKVPIYGTNCRPLQSVTHYIIERLAEH
jgi:hypothetical protein